jgi:dTDP-4-amino-4,6-dideoxygalactose transaminase
MEKEKFRIKAKDTVDNVFNKIEEMEMKRNHVSQNMKAKYDEQIAALKAKYNDLEEQYKKLQLESGQAWNDSKQKFSESADYFKSGLAKIAEIFEKDKS